MPGTATATRAEQLGRHRRAADYVTAAQLFLADNVLLREPLRPEHLKPRLLGHWGTCPRLNLVFTGLNRLARDTGADLLVVTGPGHGAPAVHANLWLEGTHGERDPDLRRDAAGLVELARRFARPGGFAANLTPDVPGTIHTGAEVGYALGIAVGAALDAPDRVVACIVGDGEAETGATAAAWHSGKFLDPVTSGAVLPIVHLNGYKIWSPTILATLDDDEIRSAFHGAGWRAILVDAGDDAGSVEADEALAMALDDAHAGIREIQDAARRGRRPSRARWPVVVVRSPKGWGTIGGLEGTPVAGTFHSHHLPTPEAADDAQHLVALETWLRSYRPDELFDGDGGVVCPDELESNGFAENLDATDRAYTWPVDEYAEHMAPDGRVMEVLSEHLCQAWLQGYLLTGRHGIFPTYESFAAVVDSMVTQHAKYLQLSRRTTWRTPMSAMVHVLSSIGWHQQANGYTHHASGSLDNLAALPAEVARIYLPPDATTLLAVAERCLDATDVIAAIVAGKRPWPVWLDLAEARAHVEAGIGTWAWAGTERGAPDVVLAAAGAVPTHEVLAAAWLLRRDAPGLQVRVVNVVDLFTLATPDRHPHGTPDDAFISLFGDTVPVVFAHHGHPGTVQQLLQPRPGSDRFDVHGFVNEGGTTTPHALLIANDLSRHQLAIASLRRVPHDSAAPLARRYEQEIDDISAAILREGVDPARVEEWRGS